jgi:type II secretory pathway pseudopilin PulG
MSIAAMQAIAGKQNRANERTRMQAQRMAIQLAQIAAGSRGNRTPGPKFLASRGIPSDSSGGSSQPTTLTSQTSQDFNRTADMGEVAPVGSRFGPGAPNIQALNSNVPPAPQSHIAGPNKLKRFLDQNRLA